MSKRLKWIIIILVLVIIILLVLSKMGVFGGNEGIKVTAEKAEPRTITEIVSASGKVFPEIEVKVSPDISGEIVELDVQEGDTVRKGQVLARIYADIYNSQREIAAADVNRSEALASNARAQLGALQAALDQAKSNYDRQKKLLDQKVISQSEFETAQESYLSAQSNYNAALQSINANKAAVQSSVANLNKASKDLSRTTIVAPMDGVISLLNVKKGESVAGNTFNVGTEMMRIADLSSMEAQVDVGENDIPKVKIGDTALVEIDAFGSRKFKGIVYKIANPSTSAQLSASSSSGTQVTNYEVHIRLLPSGYKDLIVKGQPFPFRPNMSASADIQTKTHKNVLAVPLNAVTTREKSGANDVNKKPENDEDVAPSVTQDDNMQEVVFVVDSSGYAHKKPVKTDIQDINYIEITNGLKAGERVITGPYDVVSKQLKDSSKVKVVSKDELLQSFNKQQ